jgi:RHS repeat-associated protein
LTTTDPLTHTTTIAYNSFGQPTSVKDPLNNITTFAYDTVGNLITTTDPLGNATQRAYDAVSRLTALTDPRSLTTQFQYDGLNRITEIADARHALTGFGYDPNGNLLSVADAKNQATAYTYDTMDRLATRKDALARQESYQYDANGNLRQFTDRKNQTATFTYDALNRRTGATYADGSSTSFTYDSAGRLAAVTDSVSGTIQYSYDNLDRLIQETTPQGSVVFQYDAIGRRTSMTVSGQQPVTYQYDAASRLTQVAQGGLTVGLGYDAAGRRTSLTYPNGTSASYTYDAASRLTNITHQGPSSVIESVTYTYDAAGNRLTANRLSSAATQLPAAVTAAYDAANEQVQFGNPLPPSPNLTYDANGNLTSDGTNTYTWDARNRLTAVSGGVSASFTYDALGRRISKTITGVTTQFQYDGNDIVQESGASGVATYLRSLNIDEPFVRQSSSNEYYHTDALGSVLALTGQTGSAQTTYSYEAFGKTTITGSSTNPFQYTGRENDGSGLYHFRSRYFTSMAGRFLQEDRLGIVGGDLNLYAYVWGNPLRWNDPLGAEGAVPNPQIRIDLGPDGKSLTLQFNVEAPPGTEVTIDVGSKVVIDFGDRFSNENFVRLPSGYQTGTTNQQGIATFKVDITGTPGYIQILTPGLNPRPTILTGPVGPGTALQPCAYNCNVDKAYGGPKTPPSGGSGSSGYGYTTSASGGSSPLAPYGGPSKGVPHAPKLGGRK